MLGLLSSFSPCLFPLLPTYVAINVKSESSQKQSFFSSIALILGILVVFLTLGLIVNAAFRVFLLRNYVTFARLQGSLIAVAGFFMIKTPKIFSKIQLPDRIYDMLYQDNVNRNPFLFSFGIGLIYTIIAAPCAGGYFLAVWSSLLGKTLLEQFILVLFFSIGAGFPFIFTSILLPQFRQDLMMKLHNASHKISVGLGIMLILAGIWLFTSTI